MTLVDANHGELGVKPTCDALGVSRATWCRRRARTEAGSGPVRLRSHPRRIGSDERATILAVTGSYGAGFIVCGLPAFLVGIDLLRRGADRDPVETASR